MVHRVIRTGILLWVGTLFFATMALAGPKSIHVVDNVVLPGGQKLQAGEYVVVLNQKMDQVQFLKNSRVIATSPCKCVHQQNKNKETQTLLEQGPGDTQVLRQILLQGEKQIITLTS